MNTMSAHSVVAAMQTPLQQVTPDLLSAIALVETLKAFDSTDPITVSQLNAVAHVTDMQVLEAGYQALFNPNISHAQVLEDITLATILPAPTAYDAQLMQAPSLQDDALAIQLIGSVGTHMPLVIGY